jgi:hypothetical protein
MWQLGRRCPHIAIRTLATTDVGWSLKELEQWETEQGKA